MLVLRLRTAPRTEGNFGSIGRTECAGLVQQLKMSFMSNYIYMFLDEAGNLDFTSKGSKYFVLTCVSMRRPFSLFKSLEDLKHDCLEAGRNIELFHCSRDRRNMRKEVFNRIALHLQHISVNSIVVEKAGVNSSYRTATNFYPTVLANLLKIAILGKQFGEQDVSCSDVVTITDTVPGNKKRASIERSIKTTIARIVPNYSRTNLFHHQSCSNYGLQIADYFCWAVHRKWQQGDCTFYDQIKSVIEREVYFSKFPVNIEPSARKGFVRVATPPTIPFQGSPHQGVLVIRGEPLDY